MKTYVWRRDKLKTQRKHKCCVGPKDKLKENNGFAQEPIENKTKTQVLRRNLWEAQAKHRCCIGTYGKRKENTCVAYEPMENVRKHISASEHNENTWKLQVLYGNLRKTHDALT